MGIVQLSKQEDSIFYQQKQSIKSTINWLFKLWAFRKKPRNITLTF